MPLKERTTQEDLILYEIMRNPVLCGEFLMNLDKPERDEEFFLTPYQKEILCDFNDHVSIRAGRAVGKTVSLTLLVLWLLIFNVFPNDYVIYTVPNKVHLEPVFQNIVRMLRTSSFLNHFMDPRAGINNSAFTIKLLNNSVLMCRIAGQSGTGANVIGLHTPFIILDEGGYYPWGTWIELQPTLNTWTPGYRIAVSGSPVGLRENNVLYHVDMENSNYTKHRISALQNPRFSENDHKVAIEQYGGNDTEDYIHFVLGEHGKPVFALFDRSLFEIGTYPVTRLILNGIDLHDNLGEYVNRIAMFPGLTDKSMKCVMGIDLGYTEPTAIIIMFLEHGRLKFHGRIRLNKVSYPIQERLIDLLDTKFNPIIIGMDKGSAGIGVIQNLQEGKDYLHKDYHRRIIPVDFSSWISLGLDSTGEEIKSKTKPFAVSLTQDYSNNHRIIYSSTDVEFITELERMTYSRTINGDIVYRTLTAKGGSRGEDHFTAALLCGVMAYYLSTEYTVFNNRSNTLISSSWIK
jgi:hypothetical protein